MLQSVFGEPSLSAGLWYIPIHLQLIIISLVIFKLFQISILNHQFIIPIIGVSFTLIWLSSIFYFNLNTHYDCWGLYFFGLFGCGLLTGYSIHFQPKLIILINMIVICALMMNFKIRLLLSLITADCIFIYMTVPTLNYFLEHISSPFQALARYSLSIFLIHYPILVLINSIFCYFHAHSTGMLMINYGLTVILSICLAKIFFENLEQ